MRTLSEVTLLVERVDRVELTSWIERGWVIPQRRGRGEPLFSDVDVARVCLICDLRHDLAVEEETVPLVLSLLDQVYTLRRQMNALADAVSRQPEDVRRAIMDELESSPPGNNLRKES